MIGKNYKLGFSFVEALIVIAIAVTIFGALFVTFTHSFELLAHAKAKTTATTLANNRMEYFRSLPYDDVGTVSGIPSGTIPQNSTTTMNNIVFHERVLVEYVDDPADGLLTATTTDSNGIPADYKRIKIELTWTIKEQTQSIALVSNIVPRSIETTDGGGTVRVNVLDADSAPLAGAQVRLMNNTTTTTIDVIKMTDGTGTALFSGAPAASNYEVVVTGTGYSTDQTYEVTVANPNPVTSPFSVLEADISTVTFQIGELSDLDIAAYSSVVDIEIPQWFDDSSGVATSSNTTVGSGVLRLSDTAGVYQSSGSARLLTLTPATLHSWGAISVSASAPSNTSYNFKLYEISGSSTATVIPNSDLAGNESGFTGPVIDISSLDVGDYPSIAVGIELSTTNTSVTPSVDEVMLYYNESKTPRTSMSVSLHGNKVIGTDASAQPIYKTILSGSTNVSGQLAFTGVEFDTYSFTFPAGLVVASACPLLPLAHAAGIDSSLSVLLTAAPTNSLKVAVVSNTGAFVPGATVTLSRGGFSDSGITDACGQIFFGSGVAAESDYDLTISKPGFTTVNQTALVIAGNGDTTVTISP